MNKKFQYNTPTYAIDALRMDGFKINFSLNEIFLIGNGNRFTSDDLKIIAVYRYEGNSDPADEATVYGIETSSGLKGILVVGDGIYSSSSSTGILKELHRKKNKTFLSKPILATQSERS
jgi:hypothetical protein